MATARTPAEKILLARICQRASLTAGVCSDTNNELAQATAMHLKTVSDLIGRLVEAGLVSTMVDKEQANKRNLMPRQDLLTDYPSNTDSLSTPYPSNTDGPAPQPNDYPSITDSPTLDNASNVYSPVLAEDQPVADQARRCVVTDLDISQQVGMENFVNRQTLQQLRQAEPGLFHDLATQMLSPNELTLLADDADGCDLRMAARLRRLANLRAQETGLTLAPHRLCPISEADITHQGIHYPFVTAKTLKFLLKFDRPAFARIVARLGLPDQSDEPLSDQCQTVLSRVQHLASTHAPAYPIVCAEEASATAPVPVGARRFCPITNIDITHQQSRHAFATAWTIEALYKSNRPAFDQIAAKLLPESLRQGTLSDQCFSISAQIRQLARQYRKTLTMPLAKVGGGINGPVLQ